MSIINPQGYKFEKAPINTNPFWGGGEGGSSNELWYPNVNNDGDLSWTKQETDTPPTTKNIKGPKGNKGDTGKGITSITKAASVGLVDTYQITYSDGTTGSFQVTNGAAGAQGVQGVGITSITKISTLNNVDTYQINYSNGTTSPFTVTNGTNGKSAYEIAVDNGYVGTEAEWLLSLHGADGADGESAYQVAVDNGYEGTQEEWLASLVGADGESAYQVAVDNGFVGTEQEWLASLVGPQGPAGADGKSAGLIALSQIPTPFYNPSIDNDVKIEVAIPFSVEMTDETTETGNFYGYAMLPAYGIADNRPVSAIPRTNGAMQTVLCLVEPGNTFTYANLPDILKEPQFLYLMFSSNANGQWVLFRILANESITDVATQTGAGNIYYDTRAAFANVSRQNIASNAGHTYSSGGYLQAEFTVPDYRDQSISRVVNIGFVIPALPDPVEVATGFSGELNLKASKDESWPAYGDDDGVSLNFECTLTLSEEYDLQTYQLTGKYIVKNLNINYFTVTQAEVSVSEPSQQP